MLLRTGASKEDFSVRAPDGIELRGWKVRARIPSADWVLLFHGRSDNRTGMSGHAEILLRHGYNVVMMDARAQGESGGARAYGQLLHKELLELISHYVRAAFGASLTRPARDASFHGLA